VGWSYGNKKHILKNLPKKTNDAIVISLTTEGFLMAVQQSKHLRNKAGACMGHADDEA